MDVRNEVLRNLYILLLGFILTAAVLAWKTIDISQVEGKRWRSLGDSLYVDFVEVEAERGDILAYDGKPLATSQPFFEIRMDVLAVKEDLFYQHVDSLAYCLAKHIDRERSQQEIKRNLVAKRKGGVQSGARYVLIRKKVSYSELEKLKTFPLFRLGRFKGGLIIERRSERSRPFKMLAYRTIGSVREGAAPVGLEGYFDDILKGEQGKRLMQKISGSMWVPVNDLVDIAPKRGMDIRTTLDIDLQDIAENQLLEAVRYHEAKGGSVIIMEVKTGAIRAIANLDRNGDTDEYWESFNHAVGRASEPGSTFKLASVMALLEDGLVTPQTEVDLELGKTRFYNQWMRDSKEHGLRQTTMKHAFAISSNVGIAKLVQKGYGDTKSEAQFIKRLKQFGLGEKTFVPILGEPDPFIKEAYDYSQEWSGTTLPWMSHGYELEITPLQLLSFYNAVANGGVSMRPYLVEEFQDYGRVVKKFKPTINRRAIASQTTIRTARELLNAVMEEGTGEHLKTDGISFVGKSGTTSLDYHKEGDLKEYQSTFVGYFPADDPIYSCLVTVYRPKKHGYYGGQVAGPVFRDIVQECYTIKQDLHTTLAHDERSPVTGPFPVYNIGNKEELGLLLKSMNITFEDRTDSDWAVIVPERDLAVMQKRTIPNDRVPNVKGMGVKDAVYLLESRGMQVSVRGIGKVKGQSIEPGSPLSDKRIELRCG